MGQGYSEYLKLKCKHFNFNYKLDTLPLNNLVIKYF